MAYKPRLAVSAQPRVSGTRNPTRIANTDNVIFLRSRLLPPLQRDRRRIAAPSCRDFGSFDFGINNIIPPL